MMRAMPQRIFASLFASATLMTICSAVATAADVAPSPAADQSNGAAPSVLRTAPVTTPSSGTQIGFINAAGFAVYVFDRDLTVPGTSQCNDVCATHWPAISPPATGTPAPPWGTIARHDGTKQLTYAGRPLYTYAGDTSTNRATGNLEYARGGVWRLAQPRSTSSSPKVP